MGYIGNQQAEGFVRRPNKQDLTGATGTSLTLTNAVSKSEDIDLFINDVRQEPTEAYSVGSDGVTVTLTSSVIATDDIYVIYNSLALQTSVHPSDQALAATTGTFSGAVSGTTGTFSGAVSASSFSGDGSSLTNISNPALSVYNMWGIDGNKSIASGENLLPASYWTENSVKVGSSMAVDASTGAWTFPETGIYEIQGNIQFYSNAIIQYAGWRLDTTTDNFSTSSYGLFSYGHILNASTYYITVSNSFLFDVEDITTHKIKLYTSTNATTNIYGSTAFVSNMIFKKIADT